MLQRAQWVGVALATVTLAAVVLLTASILWSLARLLALLTVLAAI
jgi:hypothetical protein